MSIERRSFFVNLEPITILGIKTHQKQIFRIYTGKNDRALLFVAVAEKIRGSALGTIFEKSQHQWIGKVGMPTGFLRNDPLTIRRRTRKEINLDTIREKLAYDLYQELGRGLFFVPKTRLSQQPIMDQFTATHPLALSWVFQGIQDSLRIMSRFVEGYQDFEKAKTEDGSAVISFMEYIKRHHRPPETLLTPDSKSVPLKGAMSLLAVGRCLADTDVLGGSGGNAGFIWKKDAQGMEYAEAVKIDPGESFKFVRDPKLEKVSINWVINTQEHLGHPDYHLQDLRNLQTSNNDRETVIIWTALTPSQQEEFLVTLFNSSRYLQSKEVLHFLFYREGAFNRSETECIPVEIAKKLQGELKAWMKLQLEIYASDLKEFKEKHPEELIRVHYIDKWGELELPMTEARFPIRDLFTHLRIVKEEKKREITNTTSSKTSSTTSSNGSTTALLMDSLDEATTDFLKLEELFDPNKNSQKILLLGPGGIGKSTICQKIAHDWASGRLYTNQFELVYWLPLRHLNSVSFPLDDVDLFLAHALFELIFKGDLSIEQILNLIRKNRLKSLIILDGYDEAAPHLKKMVSRLLQEKEYKILLTSRPGTIEGLDPYLDLRVENIGFSDDQIKEYATLFFSLNQEQTSPRLFLQSIRDNKNLFYLAHIPLQLQMLCSLWKQKTEGSASLLTDLYKQMVDQLLIWNTRKSKLSNPQEILLLLGKIASQALNDNQITIPKQVIEETLQGTSHTKQELLTTGLLKEVGEEQGYVFLHLTFQEYLMACAIANWPFEQLKELILKCRENSRYHQMFIFLCGILSQSTPHTIPLFFEALYQPPIDDAQFDKLQLGLQCLNEVTSDLQPLPAFDHYLAENEINLQIVATEFTFYLQTQAFKYLYTKYSDLIDRACRHFVHDNRGMDNSFLLVCINENLDLAKWMYQKDPSVVNKSDSTPLHAAARTGYVEMAEWFYSKDPSPLVKLMDVAKLLFMPLLESVMLKWLSGFFLKIPLWSENVPAMVGLLFMTQLKQVILKWQSGSSLKILLWLGNVPMRVKLLFIQLCKTVKIN